MLILSQKELEQQHMDARNGLMDQFNDKLEKLLNEHSSTDKYWILGKVRFPDEFQGKVGHVFLEACLEKPPLVKESFLYEVDNRRGTKTLLWVMHPRDQLSLPTLKKTISVAPKDGVKQKKNGRKR